MIEEELTADDFPPDEEFEGRRERRREAQDDARGDEIAAACNDVHSTWEDFRDYPFDDDSLEAHSEVGDNDLDWERQRDDDLDRVFFEDMKAEREAEDARKAALGACPLCTGFHPPSQPCDDGGNSVLGAALFAAFTSNRDKR